MRDLKLSFKKSSIIHLQAQIRSIMKFYATFLLRLSIIGHNKWNTEKWHISGSSDYFNSQTRNGSF